jgi:hypothetical protein
VKGGEGRSLWFLRTSSSPASESSRRRLRVSVGSRCDSHSSIEDPLLNIDNRFLGDGEPRLAGSRSCVGRGMGVGRRCWFAIEVALLTFQQMDATAGMRTDALAICRPEISGSTGAGLDGV